MGSSPPFGSTSGRVRTVRQKPPNTDCPEVYCLCNVFLHGSLAIEGETIATSVSCFRAPRCLGCSGGRRVRECLAIYPLSHSARLGQVKGEDRCVDDENGILSFLPSLALIAVWNASATVDSDHRGSWRGVYAACGVGFRGPYE